MFAVPCYGHEAFMERITPHLEDGQILVFNTGYWASVRFQDLLEKHNKKITMAETSLHVYLCRKTGPAEATIDAVKQKMLFCAMPANQTDEVLPKLKSLYPQFVAAKEFLEIHFNNLNHMVHGPNALLNTGTVESLDEKPFYFYRDGATFRVCKLAEVIDAERMAVAIISRFFTMENLPGQLVGLMQAVTSDKRMMLLMINLFLVIMGMVMDDISAVLLCTPILIPIAVKIGVSPVQLAAILGVNLGIGNITPTCAPLLYISGSINNAPINKMLRPAFAMITFGWIPTFILTTYFPSVSMWLPRLVLII